MFRFRILSLGIFSCSVRLFSQSPVDIFLQPCSAPTAQVDLDVNNVRAMLLDAGDMWWNLVAPGYEIPKSGGVNSIFSGALWFGGLNDGGQLMVAAMTYRQTGIDFWPGPIDTVGAMTTDTMCWKYDKMWKLYRSEVESFIENRNDPAYVVPQNILTWPGNGNTSIGQEHYLAPFFDNDGDGIYDPLAGDYPRFAMNGNQDCQNDLLGDQAIWWVFNDKGNTHSETGGSAFGMEIQATAFAFQTNDAINDATFYRYKIVNRSSSAWTKMWMGQYCDADLGSYDDDYVGCDVSRGMGYTYNGDTFDGYTQNQYVYGLHPPAVGIDFLQGPLADAGDVKDNDRDSLIDEPDERIKMSMFKYYNGDFTIMGNPETDLHFYYFLRGLWKDGSPQTYGNGCCSGTPAMFMYPSDSDPYGWGTGGIQMQPWSEETEGNTPFDRRFLMSVGQFSMQPGEVETVFLGVPWARDTSGDNHDAITKLKQADDLVQAFFDNCFARNCSQQPSPSFTFSANEGAVRFQSIGPDGNYQWDFGDNSASAQKQPMHTYSSSGVYHVCLNVTGVCGTQTFCDDVEIKLPVHECGPRITRLEGQGNGEQVLDLTQASVDSIMSSNTHRVFHPEYEAMHGPVKITYENYDALLDGDYRIAFDSVANTAHWIMWKVGGTDTVFADSTIASGNKQMIPQWGLAVTVTQVNKPGFQRNPMYNGFLEASMAFSDDAKQWLTGVKDRDDHTSFNWIRSGHFRNANPSSGDPCASAFDDRYFGSEEVDSGAYYENILSGTWAPYRAGSFNPRDNATNICYSTGPVWDNTLTNAQNRFENIANVDVVITSDKTKWSRCVVFETGSNPSTNQGGCGGNMMRVHASVDKQGRTVSEGALSDPNDPEAADYIGANGMGWFPGYAINVETGERLNISFGENSSLVMYNGADMLWDPTSDLTTNFNQPVFGGMHYIYVFNHNGDAVYTTGVLAGQLKNVPLYDEGRMMYTIMSSSVASVERQSIYRDAIWTSLALIDTAHSLFECDLKIRLRVQKPYAPYSTSSAPENNDQPLYGFHIEKLDLGCNMYDHEVLVFPNPFIGQCTILFDNMNEVSCQFELYDERGRLVRWLKDITSDKIVVSAEGLRQGVYFYRLTIGTSEVKTGKIVLE